MNKLKEFINSRKGKVVSITAAAFIICIAVLLVVFLNRPVAVQSSVKTTDNYATAVVLDKSALDLKTGDHDNLNAEITPDNAKDKTVHWSSSDKSVVTVSDGLVTAQGSGTAEITATSINGKTDSCSVTVSAPSTSTTPSTGTSSAGSSSTPSNSSANSGSTKQTTPSKSGTTTTNTTKPAATTKPSTKPSNTTTKEIAPNVELYKTIDGCNVNYNPAYRSIQAFVDVSGIAKEHHGEDLIVKIYRNGVYDESQSGNCGVICGNDTTTDIAFGVKDKEVNGKLVPIPATFKLVLYHNSTEFKTVTISVNEYGFC